MFRKYSLNRRKKYNLAESIKPRRMASLYKPGGFLSLLVYKLLFLVKFAIKKRLKNDDDDDDKCNRLMTNSIVLLHMNLNED